MAKKPENKNHAPLFYRINKPTLIIVAGVPGSGKTMLAEELARRIVNSAYISKDLIQTPFTKTERVTGEVYSFISGPTFEMLRDFADRQLELGKIPIVDAPFSINHTRGGALADWVTPFKIAAEKHRARLVIFRTLPPSEAELLRRIKRRRFPWDKWKLEHWVEFLKREPMDFPIPHNDAHDVITGRPAGEIAESLIVRVLGGTRVEM
jgi:predicted kinase